MVEIIKKLTMSTELSDDNTSSVIGNGGMTELSVIGVQPLVINIPAN